MSSTEEVCNGHAKELLDQLFFYASFEGMQILLVDGKIRCIEKPEDKFLQEQRNKHSDNALLYNIHSNKLIQDGEILKRCEMFLQMEETVEDVNSVTLKKFTSFLDNNTTELSSTYGGFVSMSELFVGVCVGVICVFASKYNIGEFWERIHSNLCIFSKLVPANVTLHKEMEKDLIQTILLRSCS